MNLQVGAFRVPPPIWDANDMAFSAATFTANFTPDMPQGCNIHPAGPDIRPSSKKTSLSWFLGPHAVIVAYMDPLEQASTETQEDPRKRH